MRMVAAAIACLALAASRPASACCQLGGTACGDPFAVSCNNGVVCFIPYRTCSGCTCTVTNGGQTCLATASQPGRVATLHVDRSTQNPNDLALSWSASCSGTGPDYAVHEGLLGSWYSHAPLRCTSGGALSLTITPSGGSRYYLIAPVLADFTGSLGTSSAGVERPDGSPSCTNDRALAPCP
jgi:hypothetical protein